MSTKAIFPAIFRFIQGGIGMQNTDWNAGRSRSSHVIRPAEMVTCGSVALGMTSTMVDANSKASFHRC